MKDPYLYPNTKILINKFNIKDSNLLKFHFTTFQDIYHWPGQIRTINIEKPEPALGGISIEYLDVNNIQSDIISILSKLKSIKWNELN